LYHQPSANTREAVGADVTPTSVGFILNDPVLSTEDQEHKKKTDNTQDIDQFLESFARELTEGGRDTRQQGKKRGRRGRNKNKNAITIKGGSAQTPAPTFEPTPETVIATGQNFLDQALTIPAQLITCLLGVLPDRGSQQRKLVKKTPGRRRNKKQNNNERALWQNEGSVSDEDASSGIQTFIRSYDGFDEGDSYEDENGSDSVSDSFGFDELLDENWESLSQRRMLGENQFGWNGDAVRSTDPRQ
jgi:hypothetical protein